jgi:RNA polymerase sigma-70 factor (ECF subfamily)
MTPGDFSELYQRLSPSIWAVAYARSLDSAAALDVAQECFCRLWREARNGAVIRQPRAWLLRVARNLAKDRRKCAFHRNGTVGPDALTPLRDRGASPLELAAAAEERQRVRKWLAELAEGDREILTLRYALDYDTDQIAATLEVSAAAVHMRLSRARQRLAELLRPKDEEAP